MKKRIHVNLLAGSVLVFATFLFITMGFLLLSYMAFKLKVGEWLWRVWIGAGAILALVAVLFFVWYVLRPIRKLRDAILRLEAVGNTGAVEFWADADSLADSIQALLEELRLSMEREHAEIVLRQQSKYAELQNQINPHFLYNTLETIRGQAVIDDNYKIAEMTEALAKYFRYNISKDNDSVTVLQELENIRNYIHIQQYRFQDRFRFRIYNHDESGEYAACLIPKMTLQPIVENAIFHGMEQKVEMGHLSIHIETTETCLIIVVDDDGVGMSEETLKRLNQKLKQADGIKDLPKKSGHNGIAMENVNSRLRLFYGEDYGIKVSSTPDLGTEVEITIPKVKAKDTQVQP